MVASQIPSPSSSLKGLAEGVHPGKNRLYNATENGFLRHVHAERNLGSHRFHMIETRRPTSKIANQHHIFTFTQHAVSGIRAIRQQGLHWVGPAAIDVLGRACHLQGNRGKKMPTFPKRRLRWRLSWVPAGSHPWKFPATHTVWDTALSTLISTRKRTVVIPHAAQLP